ERARGGAGGALRGSGAAGSGPFQAGPVGAAPTRFPPSCAGIYGFKPSYGRIPLHPPSGAWSLSHIGPMTRTVADAALAMDVCAGPDERDPYSLPADGGARYSRALGGDLEGLRVAYTDALGFAEVVDPEVSAVCARAAKTFRELGCRVDEVQPKWPSMMECWEQIFCGGIATRMAPHLDHQRDLIEPGLLRFIDAALKNPPTRYVQAWFDRLN